MPNRKTYTTRSQFNDYYRKYREKNRLKLRKYNREYNKAWRKKNGYGMNNVWVKANKKRVTGYRIVKKLLDNKILIKKPCKICGKKKTQACSKDPLKPINKIIWLCPVHKSEFYRPNKK